MVCFVQSSNFSLFFPTAKRGGMQAEAWTLDEDYTAVLNFCLFLSFFLPVRTAYAILRIFKFTIL